MRVVKMFLRKEKRKMHANHIMLMGRMLLVRGEESLDAGEAEWASAVEEPSAASHSTLAVDFVYFVEDPVQNIGVAHHFS